MARRSREEYVAEQLDKIEQQVEQLASEDDWRRFLDVQSKFHNYSFNNTLLILAQCPEATRVAGYRAWQEMDRQVKKGEKGIRILAPSTRTIEVEDDDTGDTEKRRVLTGFRVVSVFDLSQTEGEPLPKHPHLDLAEGEAPAHLWDGLTRQITDLGYTVTRGDADAIGSPGALGVTKHGEQAVIVRDDLPDAAAVKTLAHELAHVRQRTVDHNPDASRAQLEVEAESTAYIVCERFGVETDAYSFGYVTGWSGGDSDVVRAVGDRISRSASDVIDSHEQYLTTALEADRDRGVDLPDDLAAYQRSQARQLQRRIAQFDADEQRYLDNDDTIRADIAAYDRDRATDQLRAINDDLTPLDQLHTEAEKLEHSADDRDRRRLLEVQAAVRRRRWDTTEVGDLKHTRNELQDRIGQLSPQSERQRELAYQLAEVETAIRRREIARVSPGLEL